MSRAGLVALAAAVIGLVLARGQLVGLAVAAALVAAVGLVAVIASRGGSARLVELSMIAVGVTLPMNDVRLAPWMALSDLFLVFAATLLAVGAVTRQLTWRRPVLLLQGLALLILGGLVGGLVGSQPAASASALLRFGLAAVGVVVVVSVWSPTALQVRRVAVAMVTGAVISGVLGVAVLRDYGGRAQGLTPHPNHLALISLLALCLALALALSTSRRVAPAFAAAAVVLAAVIAESGSRAAIIGTVAALAVLVVLTRSRVLLVAAAVTAVLGVTLVAAGLFHVPEETALGRLLFSPQSVQQSDEGRSEIVGSALRQLADHPLTGVGFVEARSAHNLYLQIWVSAGLLGLVGLALVVVGVSRPIVEAAPLRAVPPGAQARVLLAGFAAGLTGYLTSVLFQNVLWDRYLWVYVALAVVFADAVRAQQRSAAIARR